MLKSLSFKSYHTLKQTSRNNKKIVVGFGDSIMSGANTNLMTFYKKRGKSLLDIFAKRINAIPINFGVSGSKVKHVLIWQLKEFSYSNIQPDIILIHVGSNDAFYGTDESEFRNNFDRLIKLLKETQALLIVLGLININRLLEIRNKRDIVIHHVFFNHILNNPSILRRYERFNEIIKEICRNNDVSYLNLWDKEFDRSDVSDFDGFHPSIRGHAKIAYYLEVTFSDRIYGIKKQTSFIESIKRLIRYIIK